MGNHLFEEVVQLTGLPESLIRRELEIILRKEGTDPKRVTLEELRKALLTYLIQTTSELKGDF